MIAAASRLRGQSPPTASAARGARLAATATSEDRRGLMMPAAKSIGWAIYAAGLIWLFGYLSTGHAPAFDWVVATPWWISTFVPNREAELGLALMFASMIPIYWRRRQRLSFRHNAQVAASDCPAIPDL
jgi:hypothetical protein